MDHDGNLAVTIKYFGWLPAEVAPEVKAELNAKKRIRGIIKHPEETSIEDLIVLKNGRTTDVNHFVENGDLVSVMLHVSGRVI
ncbi:MAG: hypothetical protein F7B59_02545 [Desulfurococcales archaeon]|nr:hypothetical protein [Desulfurococcales archaeon]